jgi:hypothetical protein
LTKTTIGLTLAAALALALPSLASAGPQIGVQPRSSGESAAFGFAFEGKFGPSSHELFTDSVAFRLDGADAVTVTGEKSTPHSITTKRAGDGQLALPKDASQLGDLIYDYNAVVKIAAQLPKSPAAGAAWKSVIPVRVSPDTWADVPVDVKVVDATAGAVSIDATGTKEATLFYKGFTFPIDVTVHMTESFGTDGRLAGATFNADELTQGGMGPKISYNWKFTTR